MMNKKPRRKVREEKEFKEVTVLIRRVNRVTAGGRQLRFSVLIAIGDENGRVGVGLGKAGEVSEAINKAINSAKKNLIDVCLTPTKTIPHAVQAKYKASEVLLMPASEGTGVIAGSFVRTICELAGIQNILSKSIGSSNKISGVQATLKALSQLRHFGSTEGKKKEPITEIKTPSEEKTESVA